MIFTKFIISNLTSINLIASNLIFIIKLHSAIMFFSAITINSNSAFLRFYCRLSNS